MPISRRSLNANRVRLFAGGGFLPFVKAVERHQAATALEGFAKCRLGVDLFRPRNAGSGMEEKRSNPIFPTPDRGTMFLAGLFRS
jgi:hypothetical protein